MERKHKHTLSKNIEISLKDLEDLSSEDDAQSDAEFTDEENQKILNDNQGSFKSNFSNLRTKQEVMIEDTKNSFSLSKEDLDLLLEDNFYD